MHCSYSEFEFFCATLVSTDSEITAGVRTRFIIAWAALWPRPHAKPSFMTDPRPDLCADTGTGAAGAGALTGALGGARISPDLLLGLLIVILITPTIFGLQICEVY